MRFRRSAKRSDKEPLNTEPEICDLNAKLSKDGQFIDVTWYLRNCDNPAVSIQIFKDGSREGETIRHENNLYRYNGPQLSSSYQFEVTIEDNGHSISSNIVHTAPNCVKNLEVYCVGDDKLLIKWERPEGAFKDYQLEVSGDGNIEICKKLTRNNYRLNKCQHSGSYKVLVIARNNNGLCSEPVEKKVEFPLPKVRSLKIKELDECFRVKWRQCKHVASCDVTVYRQNLAVKESESVELPSVKGVEIEEYKSQERNYATRYTVKVWPKNSLSLRGQEASVELQTALPAPRNVQTLDEQDKIKITWEPPCEGEFKYNIKFNRVKFFRNRNISIYEKVPGNSLLVDVPRPKIGKKYEFEIGANNSNIMKGEKKKVLHRIAFVDSCEIGIQILTKDEKDIAVLYGSDEDNLKKELQIWKSDGYRENHPTIVFVRIFKKFSYKNGIYCGKAQVSSEDGYEIRQDCLERGDHHAFCIDQEYIGKDLQFKLQNVSEGKILKAYPIRMSAAGGTQIQNTIRTLHAAQVHLGVGSGKVEMAENTSVTVQS